MLAPALVRDLVPIQTPTDVFNQSFTLYDRNGDQFQTTMGYLTAYVHLGITTASIYAVQAGAAAAVLIMLLILTKPDKRRSPVFILNSLALLFTIVATSLLCAYWVSPWYNPYIYLALDFALVPTSAVVMSICTSFFVLLVQLCVEASLILQVHVVCVTMGKSQRITLLTVSMVIGSLAVVSRIVQTIYDDKYNDIERVHNHSVVAVTTKLRDVTLAISICFFSALFCLKLGLSMHQRRRLGLRQFGPMQIIFIRGTQTMIIPVIFVILQFAFPTSKASSLVLTVTAISLPLTALWASANASNSSHSVHEVQQNAFAAGPLIAPAVQNWAENSNSNITATDRFSVSSSSQKQPLCEFRNGTKGNVIIASTKDSDVEMQGW